MVLRGLCVLTKRCHAAVEQSKGNSSIARLDPLRMLQEYPREDIFDSLWRGMTHQRLVDHLLLSTKTIVGHVYRGWRADYVDEAYAQNGFGLRAGGEVHCVEIARRFQQFGVCYAVASVHQPGPTADRSGLVA